MHHRPVPIPQNDTIWWYPAAQADGHDLLRILRRDRRLTIEFNGKLIGEDAECLADARDELFKLLDSGHFDCVIFDLTDVNIVPSGLLGLLSTAHELGCEVELLNPSPELQEVVRAARLDSWLLIRGSSSCGS